MALNLVNLLTYPRMLDNSPNYCCYGGPASGAGRLPLLLTIWFVAIPVLALFGLIVARRRGQLPEMLLVALPAAMFSVFYIFLLQFAAVRFLLPICALLSLPVAAGLVFLISASRGSRRVPAGVLVGVVLTGHLALMLATSAHVFPEKARQRQLDVKVADALRPLVAKHPCLLLVAREPPVRSYYLGCASAAPPHQSAAEAHRVRPEAGLGRPGRRRTSRCHLAATSPRGVGCHSPSSEPAGLRTCRPDSAGADNQQRPNRRMGPIDQWS